jgi:hypothetical protein
MRGRKIYVEIYSRLKPTAMSLAARHHNAHP